MNMNALIATEDNIDLPKLKKLFKNRIESKVKRAVKYE